MSHGNPSLRLRVEGSRFRDGHGREVTLRGINAAADAKFPSKPDVPSHIPTDFFSGDDVSFVGRPFPLSEAPLHFSRLRRYGYNAIRYVFTWEAVEHAGPGKYDEEWIDYTIAVLREAKKFGFYIWMDPHQDVWSRFSGGSGAPLWTLYAMGLEPRNFQATEAALVHNVQPDPADYPKMIWSTNYTRMVCQVAFTLFFGGRTFAPKAVIDGKNIQDYLQDHFIDAYAHVARRIHEAGDLEKDVVIGWESMNEPNRGLISVHDIGVIPPEQKLQKGTSPTAWQAILTASGRACEIDTWDFGGLGPYKTGSQLVDPKGVSAWLPADYDDGKYGWKRDPGWKLGTCLWAQHGVWDPEKDLLLKKDYFGRLPGSKEMLTYEHFTNTFFMEYYRKHARAIKAIFPDAVMLCQPPVLEIPPTLKHTADDDPNMVYTPHYYDGVTLMTKKWNRLWNVDVFGILRGKYLTPAFAIKIGETAIRNCIRDQLSAIRQEGVDYMGNHPCIFSEIGIPYDMDDKYAYKTGDYTSQALAMDANHFALEGSGVAGYGLWVYVANNCHKWGDLWNGEDLSIFSLDDKPLPVHSSRHLRGGSTAAAAASSPSSSSIKNTSDATLNNQTDPGSPSFSRSHSTDDPSLVSPSNLRRSLTTHSMSSDSAGARSDPDLSTAGFRAAEAYVRPSPVYTAGDIKSSGFDLRNAKFELRVAATTKADPDHPTEIFLPDFHFPKDATQVEASAGKWEIYVDDGNSLAGKADDGENSYGEVQRLRWWNGAGEQSIVVTGLKRKIGMKAADLEDEEGYLEQCQQQKCSVM